MTVHSYAFCDVYLSSTIEFPELQTLNPKRKTDLQARPTPLSSKGPSLWREKVIRCKPIDSGLDHLQDNEGDWVLRWEFPDKSAQVFRNEQTGQHRYRLDSIHGPRFYVSDGGAEIGYELGFGDNDTMRHLLIDQVLPRVLSADGSLMLHAACIETEFGAVAIFGESGQGKSTLSYALQEAGCRVLSDDCAKLEIAVVDGNSQVFAISTYPSLRLWPDVLTALAVNDQGSIPVAGYNTKRRVDVTVRQSSAGDLDATPVVLGIVLGDRTDGEPLFTPMTKGKALLEMVKQTFHLDVRDRGIQQRSFQQVDDLVRVLPMFHLSYPSGLESMPQIARFVIENVAQTSTA